MPRFLIALLVAAAAAALIAARSSGGGSAGQTLSGRVVRVVDGDTVHVAVGGRDETVRYIGMDTPESVKPGVPVQCYAKAASHENARLVDGQQVRLVVGAEPRDKYGRLLAYVYRTSDGLFVNASLVRDGFAKTLEIAPNTRFAARFRALQTAAQERRSGLWGRC